MKKRQHILIIIFVIAGCLYFLKFIFQEPQKKVSFSQSKIVRNREVIQSKPSIPSKKSIDRKVSSPTNDSENYSLAQAFCILKKLKAEVPMSEYSKFGGYFGPNLFPIVKDELHSGEPIIQMAIIDENCPKNKYSIVKAKKIEGRWTLEKTLSCTQATNSELFAEYGRQYTIELLENYEPGTFQFAITGPGMFVTDCRGELVLTRSGSFRARDSGVMVNPDGCILLDTKLRPMKSKSDNDFQLQGHCTEDSQCAALLNRDYLPQLKGDLIKPFIYSLKNGQRIKVQELLKLPEPYPSNVLINAIEKLAGKDILPGGLSKNLFKELENGVDCI